VTPDSFSDGTRFQDPKAACRQGVSLVRDGARILDIGAESTRPGASAISWEDEWQRLEPVIRNLRQAIPSTPLSLDTRHAETATRGLEAGVAVLNDVTGFRDPAMLDLAKQSRVPLLAMRCRMRHGSFWMPPYDAPGSEGLNDIVEELREIRDRLLHAGIAPERITLDPGFGFGTTWNEDKALWDALPDLPDLLEWPASQFCIGISRKRFVAWMAGDPGMPAPDRDVATARLHSEAISLGYSIFRTHSILTDKVDHEL
jgi:dihydropteroate synthase